METNIILAGVGGQGILAISFVIDMTAINHGLSFKQAEVHGMSQRGGAVSSHLRVSDVLIHSDLIPKGQATLILAVEPLESLRYVEYLSPKGAVVTSIDLFVNIDNYGDLDALLGVIATIPEHIMLPADRLARQAGTAKAQNMVMLGAATAYLSLPQQGLETSIEAAFDRKGERVKQVNINALRVGMAAGQAYRALLAAGLDYKAACALVGRLDGGKLDKDAVEPWKDVLTGANGQAVIELCAGKLSGKVIATAERAEQINKLTNPDADTLKGTVFAK